MLKFVCEYCYININTYICYILINKSFRVMETSIQEIIDKYFRDEKEIWFDYKDNIKSNYSLIRRGISWFKKYGKYEISLISEVDEPILLCTLDSDEGDKLLSILKIMYY